MKSNLLDIKLKKESLGKIDNSKFIIPYSLKNFANLFLEYPSATIVAGATDVGLWITKDLSCISPLIFIANLEELRTIMEGDDYLEFGSCVTYSEAQPVFLKYFPEADDYLSRIAGEQIRNVGTLGGNIGNGSPIGDLAPLFIALRGTMSLRKGEATRKVAIENFFLDYRVQDIKESEFIEKIFIPRNESLLLFSYKISKRRDEDISTVSAVFSFEVLEKKIVNVRLVFGGMAGTPKRATSAESTLEGRVFDFSIVKLAQLALETDFKPMSDMRASSAYRMKIAKNLIQKCQLEFEQNVKLQLSRED
jgi:xanthine dehydrogenase small subunit